MKQTKDTRLYQRIDITSNIWKIGYEILSIVRNQPAD